MLYLPVSLYRLPNSYFSCITNGYNLIINKKETINRNLHIKTCYEIRTQWDRLFKSRMLMHT